MARAPVPAPRRYYDGVVRLLSLLCLAIVSCAAQPLDLRNEDLHSI